jgi:predicted membrane protein
MTDIKNFENNNRLIPGIFLLVAGGVMLAYKMGAPLPWWLFSWPMLLIVIGIFNGVRSNFQNPSWLILLIIGSVFLLGNISEAYNFRKFLVPLILLSLGLFFILKPNSLKSLNDFKNGNLRNGTFTDEDGISSVNIFSGSKKNIFSKDFKGGETVNIMGGSELNFMQADIQGKVIIESVNIMGGTKLILPSNWVLQSEVVSIFGGVDDKRMVNAHAISEGKVIVLKGVNIFGGIDIKSY